LEADDKNERKTVDPDSGCDFFVLLSRCITPNNGYLMELNRRGKWKEAERIGLDMLGNRGTFAHSEIYETSFHVIYAQTRMGKKADTAILKAEYGESSQKESIDPELLWLGREMARLKRELGLLDPVQYALVSAMEENGAGKHAAARDLCDSVLGMDAANATQRAVAAFVAASCSIRLKEARKAEEYLTTFNSLKGVLPAGHQCLAEEPYVRSGLRELLSTQEL
jgi:hypothetical protein